MHSLVINFPAAKTFSTAADSTTGQSTSTAGARPPLPKVENIMHQGIDFENPNIAILNDLVGTMARSLVSKPELVRLEIAFHENTLIFRLYTDPHDVPLVVGREGRTARALRTIVGGASMKLGQRARLEIMNRLDASGEVSSGL
jgi:hypothetical protein